MTPVLLAKLVKLALCQRRKAACMEQAAFFSKKKSEILSNFTSFNPTIKIELVGKFLVLLWRL